LQIPYKQRWLYNLNNITITVYVSILLHYYWNWNIEINVHEKIQKYYFLITSLCVVASENVELSQNVFWRCLLKFVTRGCTQNIIEKLQHKWCVTKYKRDLTSRPWTNIGFSWCLKIHLRVDDLTGQ